MDNSFIPPDKSEAVVRGLREAFGVTEFEDIRRITKGQTSALVFRIVALGTPYLLRVIVRPNTFVDPARQFHCMKLAEEAGVAPRVLYSSIEDGVLIADFVEEAPFSQSDALVRMPALLRTLHGLAPFPETPNGFDTTCMFLVNPGAAMNGWVQKFRSSETLPKPAMEDWLRCHEQLMSSYSRREEDMVPSHNDLYKPDNILFDGQRAWLVDWEAAFLNDRYVDLATVANLIVTNDVEERALLREYFGAAPTHEQRARFSQMRRATHLFYAMVFLQMGSEGKSVDLSEQAPDYAEFHRRMWAGEVRLLDAETKLAYGRVHLERLLTGK